MFQFSFIAICLVFVLHGVILVLVMVLQVTFTVRHQMLAHAYGSDRKKAYEFEMSPATCTCIRMPFQMPASVAQWAEAQCAPTGTVCRRGGVQSRVGW